MNYEDRVTKEYIENALGSCARIATGSYIGTGEYGTEHPVTLTLGFAPKLVIVAGNGGCGPDVTDQGVWEDSFIWISGTTFQRTKGSTGGTAATFVLSEDSLGWFSGAGAKAQLNLNGSLYYYIAIG